ncbi:hypothetical protein H0H87_005125 [Tephrocybe sp. NHM501043]|nr:hypothetical protein H0H87_005125 [Tephrocybe sp. NHM501043]
MSPQDKVEKSIPFISLEAEGNDSEEEEEDIADSEELDNKELTLEDLLTVHTISHNVLADQLDDLDQWQILLECAHVNSAKLKSSHMNDFDDDVEAEFPLLSPPQLWRVVVKFQVNVNCISFHQDAQVLAHPAPLQINYLFLPEPAETLQDPNLVYLSCHAIALKQSIFKGNQGIIREVLPHNQVCVELFTLK